MSQEQPMQSRALAGRQQIRVRLDQFKSSPGLNVIGLPELIGLAVAAVLALITIFAYFYFLVPANSRLTSNSAASFWSSTPSSWKACPSPARFRIYRAHPPHPLVRVLPPARRARVARCRPRRSRPCVETLS